MLTWKRRSDGCEFADTGGSGRYTIHPTRDDPDKLVMNLNGAFIGTFPTGDAAKARAEIGREVAAATTIEQDAYFAGRAS